YPSCVTTTVGYQVSAIPSCRGLQWFNDKFREECSNDHWSRSIPRCQGSHRFMERECNENRPNSSLGSTNLRHARVRSRAATNARSSVAVDDFVGTAFEVVALNPISQTESMAYISIAIWSVSYEMSFKWIPYGNVAT